MTAYRPWGHVDWLLDRLPAREWSLVGCAGTEPRSTALALHLGRERFTSARMLAIRDPQPLDSEALLARLADRKTELVRAGFPAEDIVRAHLLADLDSVRAHVTGLADQGARSLLLDITSLPKLWFFPMLQAAIEDDRFADILVTYTSATGYADKLSENNAPLRTLPGFYAEDGRTTHDSIIIGIGFEPLGLLPLIQDHDCQKIRLIFPFPPGPPAHHRNWMFVHQIEKLLKSEDLNEPTRVHIHMYDVPQVFEAMCEMTDKGHKASAVAPYGPKTVSLAMCLFALAAQRRGRPRVPAFYSQPQRYSLDYSQGVARRGNAPDTMGYCVRLCGRNLYDLP